MRRVLLETDAALGARWWNESFQAFQRDTPTRRQALLSSFPLLVTGGVGALVLGSLLCSRDDDNDDSATVTLNAIDLQRREGWNTWNAGRADPILSLPGLMTDVEGSTAWMGRLTTLHRLLAQEDRVWHLGVATLFQSLDHFSSDSLRQVIRPVHGPGSDDIFARGQALRELAERPDAPTDLALIIDLPGEQAVTLAAALSPRFSPVFTFDNWPHPLGVVPSHLTLGAILYYLPTFLASKSTRPPGSPIMFVLDANRLAPYRDQATQFDNRYVAPLPSAATLAGLGIKRFLYVRPDERSLTELDDLNADFVAWQQGGIDVRALPLTDFSAADLTAAGPAQGRASAGVTTAQGVHASHGTPGFTSYYYGGHSHHHVLFWRSYGFGSGPAPSFSRRQRLSPPPAARLSNAPAYRPSFRPTLFSSRSIGGVAGVGKQKPSGFGRVSVRMNSVGRVTGVGSRRRSGSFGRSRSSYSG